MSKSITAILLAFRRGKNTDRAALDSCTGWVKYMGGFHESKTYEFTLDAQLSKGIVEIILLDKNKQQLMKLNQQSPTERIKLKAETRYYLRWNF